MVPLVSHRLGVKYSHPIRHREPQRAPAVSQSSCIFPVSLTSLSSHDCVSFNPKLFGIGNSGMSMELSCSPLSTSQLLVPGTVFFRSVAVTFWQ